MGCSATRPINFAQVVPGHDGQEQKEEHKEGAAEAGWRDHQRRRSNRGGASQDVPTIDQTSETKPDRQAGDDHEAQVKAEEGEMPKAAEDREASKQKQLGSIFSAVVSEPKSLVTWSSYEFRPRAQDFASGHPLPPCATSQEAYRHRILRRLASIIRRPFAFQHDVMERRDRFDQKAQKRDEEVRGAQ
eukprot:TRINITY_DN9445_c0_g3_i1.p1 TRINITY_DN9445_c0_g3~~TRINITY_DN9445_c0_g3_i1.p1  ORF type:complete len:188 (+),score=37.59 TRINITY_DN9445_c0_g3_i1:60-623(+)